MTFIIGYDRESPAFLIYDRSTGAIKKSRNVKFDITVPDIYEPIDESIVVNKNDVIDVDQVIKKLIEVYI